VESPSAKLASETTEVQRGELLGVVGDRRGMPSTPSTCMGPNVALKR
jgi:hypothetical protein